MMFEYSKKFIDRKYYKNPLIVKDMSRKFIIKLFRSLFIVGLCYLFLFPLFYMVSVSLQDLNTIYDPSVIWIPKKISFNGILATLKVLRYFDSISLTAKISIGSTIMTLISCSLVGYGFARFDFTEKKLAFALVMLTIIVPPQTILISSYLNYRFFNFGGILNFMTLFGGSGSINLLNTSWTFILPSMFACGLRGGLFIFIFRQFFVGMPKDLEEAAKIDGCNALKTFVRIIVPLATPAFITVLLFSFIWHWNDLYSSAMYFTQQVRPVTVMLQSLDNLLKSANLYSSSQSPYEVRIYMEAGCLLTILPPLVLYIFTQKYFTESIERTGIVG